MHWMDWMDRLIHFQQDIDMSHLKIAEKINKEQKLLPPKSTIMGTEILNLTEQFIEERNKLERQLVEATRINAIEKFHFDILKMLSSKPLTDLRTLVGDLEKVYQNQINNL